MNIISSGKIYLGLYFLPSIAFRFAGCCIFLIVMISCASVKAPNEISDGKGRGITKEVDEAGIVDKGINLVMRVCGAQSTKIEIVGAAGGDINITEISNNTKLKEVTIKHTHLEGIIDGISEAGVKEATERRNCMEPYAKKLLDLYLGQSNPEVKEVVINFDTPDYFQMEEFKIFICSAARYYNSGSDYIAPESAQYALGRAKSTFYHGIFSEVGFSTIYGLNGFGHFTDDFRSYLIVNKIDRYRAGDCPLLSVSGAK